MAFVTSSWLISLWESGYVPDMEYAAYLEGQKELIRRVSARGVVRVVEFEGIDEVLGYSVVEEHPTHGSVLQYCYVKKDFRRQHIGAALCQYVKPGSSYSARTRVGKKFVEKLQLEFNPYLVF